MESIYKRIGEKGLEELISRAVPWYIRLFVHNQSKKLIKEILTNTSNLEDVKKEYKGRLWYEEEIRALPSLKRALEYLKEKGIE